MKRLALLISMLCSAAGCTGHEDELPPGSASCADKVNDGSTPWTISSLKWTFSGGATVALSDLYYTNGITFLNCLDSAQVSVDVSGNKSGNQSALSECQPAAALGECVGATYDVTPGPRAYSFADGSKLTLVESPPSISRVDAAGAVVYQTALTDFDRLASETDARGGFVYAIGSKSGVDSVVRLDLTQGQVAWSTPILGSGKRL